MIRSSIAIVGAPQAAVVKADWTFALIVVGL
jgi:hypothetical protein